jgi:hypothetical protein
MAEHEASNAEAFILGRTPFDVDAIRAFAERIVDAMRQRPETARATEDRTP